MEFDQHLYTHQTLNMLREHGLPFVMDCIYFGIETLGKSTEERLIELGEINKLLKIRKRKPITNQAPLLFISELAMERYKMNLSFDKRTVCPFHAGADNPSSFILNDDNNTFHCFSCGISGGIVKFVELMEEKNGE